ncbi:hypothetical protein EHR01_12390 [Leptospira mtsangambouensis]|uniref:DUF600 family protein n=1 Tax=Leptospira mtsangambouensis TaxID=2484912 RepID=A0ABY2NZH5_9LEPT|nr:hypothetical protein [Leptospira mtsangambouensis]TGM74294.1 hypothetical protein EHR01_12390 [Leptospira mtsangambouensis]
MEKIQFDLDLQSLCKEAIETAFNFIKNNEKETDVIYFFGTEEQKVSSTGVFYKINKNIVELHEVNNALKKKVDNSNSNISTLLNKNLDILYNILTLFKQNNREIPTQIKIIYNIKENKLEIKLDYKFHFSNHKTKRPSDIFDEWINSIKLESK